MTRALVEMYPGTGVEAVLGWPPQMCGVLLREGKAVGERWEREREKRAARRNEER